MILNIFLANSRVSPSWPVRTILPIVFIVCLALPLGNAYASGDQHYIEKPDGFDNIQALLIIKPDIQVSERNIQGKLTALSEYYDFEQHNKGHNKGVKSLLNLMLY